MQTREYDDYIASGFGGYRFQTWRNMRINQLSEVLTNVQTNPNNVKVLRCRAVRFQKTQDLAIQHGNRFRNGFNKICVFHCFPPNPLIFMIFSKLQNKLNKPDLRCFMKFHRKKWETSKNPDLPRIFHHGPRWRCHPPWAVLELASGGQWHPGPVTGVTHVKRTFAGKIWKDREIFIWIFKNHRSSV